MPTIKNLNQLDKVIQPYIEKAMKLTRDEIFEIVSEKISDYYNEPVFSPSDTSKPDFYDRTGTLMESLTASNLIKNGGNYSFTVGFDDEYLTFLYDGNANTLHSFLPNNRATGLQVLEWMNSGSHGGNVKGNHNYWDEALQEIGDVSERFKKNLRKVGLPIK